MDWTAQLKPNVDWTVQFLKQLWTGQPAKKNMDWAVQFQNKAQNNYGCIAQYTKKYGLHSPFPSIEFWWNWWIYEIKLGLNLNFPNSSLSLILT